MKPEIESDA